MRKTSENKTKLTHYNDMMTALMDEKSKEDRLELVLWMISKIAVQFDHKKYVNDGLNRVINLVGMAESYDFGKPEAKTGAHCLYCRYNDICLGKK